MAAGKRAVKFLPLAGDKQTVASLIITGVKETGVEIGVGAYGRVFEVEYCGTICAAKEVHSILLRDGNPGGAQRVKENFLRECQQCADLRHPNVVQFLGVYYRPGTPTPIMVMEKMVESLRNSLERHCQDIPVTVQLGILLDVALGLRYLHSHKPPIVHRDLSSNNILLTTFLRAKISDLGVAKVIKQDYKSSLTKVPGTVDFMPPESMCEDSSLEYGTALDVFSFGAVMLHVATQEWPTPLAIKMYDTARRKPMALTEVERRKPYIDKMTDETSNLKPLILSCLDDDPAMRPNIVKVSESIKKAQKEQSPFNLFSLLDQATEQNKLLESRITEKTKEIDQLKQEIDRLKNQGHQDQHHHNAVHPTHSNTISNVPQADVPQAGTDNHVGVCEKTKSLPARDIGRGSPKLMRWGRVHEYEEIVEDMLDDVDIQNAQLYKNESDLKNHVPNVVVSNHTSSKSFPRSVRPGHEYKELGDDDDDENDVPSDPPPQCITDFLRVTESPEAKRDKKLRREVVLVRRHSSVECERDLFKAKADHEAIVKRTFISDVMKKIYRPKPKQSPKTANQTTWFRAKPQPAPRHQSPKNKKPSDETAMPPKSPSTSNHFKASLTGTPPLPRKDNHFGSNGKKTSAHDPIDDRPPMPTPR